MEWERPEQRGRRGPVAWVTLAAAAFAVVAVSALGGGPAQPASESDLLIEHTPADRRRPAAPIETPTGPPEGRWRSLEAGPLPHRRFPATVWTGREVLVWGGAEPRSGYLDASADGAAYDPAVDGWRTLPAGPLAPRFAPAAVWAGDRMVVWGGLGQSTPGVATELIDGASYDPEGDVWRVLSPAPLPGRFGAVVAWTGEEAVVWGGSGGTPSTLRRLRDGAAYDPAADRWRKLPGAPAIDGPAPVAGAWSGTELVVWDGRNAIAYDPSRNSWRVLPPAPLSDDAAAAVVWTGDEVAVLGLDVPNRPDAYGVAYNPNADRWRIVRRPRGLPWRVGGGATATAAGRAVALWQQPSGFPPPPSRDPTPGMWLWRPDADTWAASPRPGASGMDPNIVWTGREVLLWTTPRPHARPTGHGWSPTSTLSGSGPQAPARRPFLSP